MLFIWNLYLCHITPLFINSFEMNHYFWWMGGAGTWHLNPLVIPSVIHFADNSPSQTTVCFKKKKSEEVEYLGASLKIIGKHNCEYDDRRKVSS